LKSLKLKKILLHISEVDVTTTTGMGRVEWHWRNAFERTGIDFIHIGPKEVGPVRHPATFPFKAYRYFKNLRVKPFAIIVHEPVAGSFVNEQVPCFLESHGIERRFWEMQLKGDLPLSETISPKTRLLFPLWRLRKCDKGLRKANKLLLINNEDVEFVKSRYGRADNDIFAFKNGVDFVEDLAAVTNQGFTIVFNGSWIERKGIYTLVKAAAVLFNKGLDIYYVIAGSGKEVSEVLKDWPDDLQRFITVIPKFESEQEKVILLQASLYVLPSYFEGQPLSLLQAMAAGKCCVTTNCCGQKDMIVNGVNGLLFEPGDYTELARLIQYCYDQSSFVKKMGENAQSFVADRAWSRVSEEVVDFVINNSKSV
jgi:glycosyltransferase involved in cell wall biosynthesis